MCCLVQNSCKIVQTMTSLDLMSLLQMDSKCMCVFDITTCILPSDFCRAEGNFSRMSWKRRDQTCLGPLSSAWEPHGYRPMTTGPEGLSSIPRRRLFRTLLASGVRLPDNTHSHSPSLFLAGSGRQLIGTELSSWLWSLSEFCSLKAVCQHLKDWSYMYIFDV